MENKSTITKKILILNISSLITIFIIIII